ELCPPGAELRVRGFDGWPAAVQQHQVVSRYQPAESSLWWFGRCSGERLRRVHIPESDTRAGALQLENGRGELHVPAADAAALGDKVSVARALQLMRQVVPASTHAH